MGERRGSVLSIRPFRRLWIALSLSSLGDWLSLLALSILANNLGGSRGAVAVSGVWLTSLLPALIFGPLAGAVADRFDRRTNMIIGDVVRAVLYISIPLNLAIGAVDKLTWLYVAQFLASCASLFWTPAKDASVPNLVPPDQLEQANQYSLFTTYGTAPIAGLLFAILGLASRALGQVSHYFATNPVNLALYFNAITFVVSALTIVSLRDLPAAPRERGDIGAVGAEVDLGGLALPRPDPGGPRHHPRHDGRVRGRRRGRRPRAVLHRGHPERRQRGLGRRVRGHLLRPGRGHVPGPAHPAAASPGGGCSACRSPPPRCRWP